MSVQNINITNKDFTAQVMTDLCRKPELEVLRELASQKLIKNSQKCECGNSMRLIKNKRKQSGYWWLCKIPCGKTDL
jgi:hypothetical protein